MLTKDAMAALERLDRAAEAIADYSANIAQLATGLTRDAVLESGYVMLAQDPTMPTGWGKARLESHMPHASIAVTNLGTMTVTVSTSSSGSSLPGASRGTVKIPAGGFLCVPLAGQELHFYGRAGELVNVTRYLRAVPPAAAQAAAAPWHTVTVTGLVVGQFITQYSAPWGEQAIYGGLSLQETTGPVGTGDTTELAVVDVTSTLIVDQIALAGRESVGEEASRGRLCAGPALSIFLGKGSVVGSMFVR